MYKRQIYALEPTVLQDGGLPCAIIEDDVLLTDDGCELISRRQTALIEIPYRDVYKRQGGKFKGQRPYVY